MSPIVIIYIICSIIAGCSIILCEWWAYRYMLNRDITLQTLMVGICMIFIPLFNIITIFLCVLYFFEHIAPSILIVKRKK